MGNLKWGDIAHHYINSEIKSVQGNFLAECREGQCLWQACDEARQDFPFDLPSNDLPILRHLEDMTPQERMDLIKRQNWYNDYEEYRLIDTPPSPIYGGHHTLYEVFRHGKWLFGSMNLVNNDIKVLCELIEKGFDLFGLIESGEAIRKGRERA